ncbi:citrate/2-methylcitrate synthase [Calditrichota bacterium]
MIPIKQVTKQTYNRGLENLIAGETAISKIDGLRGKLWFRGYDVKELAVKSSFEEVSYLIIHGELPTSFQLERWREELEQWHDPPMESLSVLNKLPSNTQALMLYRTMLSVAACHIPEGENVRLDAQWRRPARILAWCSTIAAAAICHIRGIVLKPHDPEMSFAANFLIQSLDKEFSDFEIKVFDTCLVVQAEHGFHAAALAALTVISTGADLGSAVLAGMGALSGKLHGGACEFAFDNIIRHKSVEEAKTWVQISLGKGYKFPGFGHRIYKTHDPRVKILEPLARKLLKSTGNSLLWENYCSIRDEIEAALGEKGIFANVDGITGLIYHALGLPRESFTIPFAIAITSGWMAHCLEYLSEGKMIEPGAIYTGN